MRSRWLVIGAVEALLGATVAYLGATRMFICRDTPSFEAVCAGGFPLPAVAWGATIGSVAGLLIGLLLSRRLASKGHINDPSSGPRM